MQFLPFVFERINTFYDFFPFAPRRVYSKYSSFSRRSTTQRRRRRYTRREPGQTRPDRHLLRLRVDIHAGGACLLPKTILFLTIVNICDYTLHNILCSSNCISSVRTIRAKARLYAYTRAFFRLLSYSVACLHVVGIQCRLYMKRVQCYATARQLKRYTIVCSKYSGI